MKAVFQHSDKKVIFFDLYDTLIDCDMSFAQALNDSLVEFTARWDNQQWSPATAVDHYQKEWAKITMNNRKGKSYTRKLKLSNTKEQNQLLCLSRALHDSPFKLTDSFLRILLKRTKELYIQRSSLFADVKTTLEQLNEQFNLAIISNGRRERIIQVIQQAGLSHLFPNDHIFVPSSPRSRKPSPRLFHKALKLMNVQPQQTIMVGNSWRNDIFGGNRCGLDTVWIQYKNQKSHLKRIGRNKVVTIARFKQLLSLFN